MLINSSPELPQKGGAVGVSPKEAMKMVRNLELLPAPLNIHIEISQMVSQSSLLNYLQKFIEDRKKEKIHVVSNFPLTSLDGIHKSVL